MSRYSTHGRPIACARDSFKGLPQVPARPGAQRPCHRRRARSEEAAMAAGGCHPICHDLLPAGCVLSLWCVQRGGLPATRKKGGKCLTRPPRLVLFYTPRLMPCVHGWPGSDPRRDGRGNDTGRSHRRSSRLGSLRGAPLYARGRTVVGPMKIVARPQFACAHTCCCRFEFRTRRPVNSWRQSCVSSCVYFVCYFCLYFFHLKEAECVYTKSCQCA